MFIYIYVYAFNIVVLPILYLNITIFNLYLPRYFNSFIHLLHRTSWIYEINEKLNKEILQCKGYLNDFEEVI